MPSPLKALSIIIQIQKLSDFEQWPISFFDFPFFSRNEQDFFLSLRSKNKLIKNWASFCHTVSIGGPSGVCCRFMGNSATLQPNKIKIFNRKTTEKSE